MSRTPPSVGGVILAAVFALAVGFVIATGYMHYRLNGHLENIDFLLIPLHLAAIREHLPKDFLAILVAMGAPPLLVLVLSTAVLNEALTTFGKSRWQTLKDMKREGFCEEPGYGFLLAKVGSPKGRGPYLCSTSIPHAYLTGPTGSGKGVSFVIPNLLTCKGSTVTLDVKGEIFRLTSRHRLAMKDRVIRFAPGDFSDKGSHRYNPLDSIMQLTDPDEQMMELRQKASLFLDSGNPHNDSFLQGGIDLFVACGMLSIQRGSLSLGVIHDLSSGGMDKRKYYAELGAEATNRAVSLLFVRLASTNEDTLTSYLSLLMNSGLNAWSNPATQALTATSDFSFADIRRRPHAIYFDVGLGRLEMFAPLIRLFFADLIATLQDHEPGPDEPFPVMIMLDEFEQLGRMASVANSIKTLRSYGGHLALVSQTIPGVDAIYSENVRLALQGGSGLQLYFTPSDRKTAEEISHSLGRTTKRVISKSSPLGMAPLKSRSRSERTEDAPLMSEDEVRSLPDDEVIIIPRKGGRPIRAQRIVYWQDRQLNAIFQAQKGPLPYPPKIRPDRPAPASPAVPAPAPATPVAPAFARQRPHAVPVVELRPDMVPAEALSSLRTRQTRFGIHQKVAEAQRASLQRARPTMFMRQSLAVVKPEEAESIRVANGKVLTLEAMMRAGEPAEEAKPVGGELMEA